jgi:hypothetical protein
MNKGERRERDKDTKGMKETVRDEETKEIIPR